ncbi:MAG: TonB-dependent receptor [Bacteroidota bacterium]
MNYLYPGFSDPAIGDQLIHLPVATIFSPENVKAQNGFVIEEGTTNIDHYHGDNTYTAAYVSGQFPLGKFDLNVGFRAEYNVQKLTALGNDGTPIKVNNPVFAPLPSFNLAYNTSERSLVRLAYSRTVNRPEFRELAPFLFYQFEFESALVGNPNLKTAFVDNIDLRYEWYPNPGETFSVGGFYKNIKIPLSFTSR